MPPAVIAGVGAAASIGGAILGANAQKSAADKAVATQMNATNQQLQLGRESLATQKQMFDANFSTLSPFVGNGLVASNAMNALLGLPAAQPMISPLAQASVTAGGAPAPAPSAPAAPTGLHIAGLDLSRLSNPTNALLPRIGG
jgi:hypothetical protein